MNTIETERSPARESWRDAARALGKRDRLLCAAATLLFLIAAIIACWIAVQLAATLAPENAAGTALIVLALVLAALCAVFVLLPLFLGRWRLLGRMCTAGEHEFLPVREMFYYFTSRARYARALRVLLAAALAVLLPAGLFAGAAYALAWLYVTYLTALFSASAAALLSVLSWLLYAMGIVLYLLCFARLLLVVPVAVGCEALGVKKALCAAWRAGRGNTGVLFAALWGSLWRFAVGIATVGVAQLLYFEHQTVGAWFLLAMRLTAEGEQDDEG